MSLPVLKTGQLIRYQRFRKQFLETDDAEKLKSIQESLDSEETKKYGDIFDATWFELTAITTEMMRLSQSAEEREEITTWVSDEQYAQVNKMMDDRLAIKKQLNEKLCSLNINASSEKDLGDRIDLIVPELSENANLVEGEEWWHKLGHQHQHMLQVASKLPRKMESNNKGKDTKRVVQQRSTQV